MLPGLQVKARSHLRMRTKSAIGFKKLILCASYQYVRCYAIANFMLRVVIRIKSQVTGDRFSSLQSAQYINPLFFIR
ncbi:hypothetical protein F7734_10445 [Scytonema sp. UIC 10036]|uniref:hypothetical protein n=1 Tax=Scytonema sp. UIC 10036 TaxID=2304196 RepID=UPI0012DAE503|nr:hypothetical protein [Scytonema sp. UIC 10036]MUG92845.1 hypothetical protein [Scytonema sp. UIC 10036]